jgi:hypothetical protein
MTEMPVGSMRCVLFSLWVKYYPGVGENVLVAAAHPSGTSFLWRQFSNVYAADAGGLWTSLYVDGVSCEPVVRWACLPARQWTHVLLQSSEAVTQRLFLMADASTQPHKHLQGLVSEVVLWSRVLTTTEAAVVAGGTVSFCRPSPSMQGVEPATSQCHETLMHATQHILPYLPSRLRLNVRLGCPGGIFQASLFWLT